MEFAITLASHNTSQTGSISSKDEREREKPIPYPEIPKSFGRCYRRDRAVVRRSRRVGGREAIRHGSAQRLGGLLGGRRSKAGGGAGGPELEQPGASGAVILTGGERGRHWIKSRRRSATLSCAEWRFFFFFCYRFGLMFAGYVVSFTSQRWAVKRFRFIDPNCFTDIFLVYSILLI